jgi:broad specificity phosphatase PhoE
MRLYLIRHGKTDAYLENKRQSPESTLGELGKDQANRLAARLKNVEFDVLISSHWPRAKQTAEIIAQE